MLEELIIITIRYRLQRREIQNGRDSSPWAERWTTLWREKEGRHLQMEHTNLQNVLRQESSRHCFQQRHLRLGVN